MKIKLLVLIFLAFSLAAFSQGHKASSDSASYKINTVFGTHKGTSKIPLGYFLEFNAGYTRFGHKNVFLPGISMGLILNHNWSVGVTGSFIGNPQGLHYHHVHYDSTGQTSNSANLRGGFGGALIEYTLFPKSRLHVSFPLMIGGGYLYWNQVSSDYHSQNLLGSYSNHSGSGAVFFVIEPGVRMEVNLAKMFRLGLGISYRYAPDLDLKHASENLINQFTAKLSLRFGKF
ncbi:MAG: hypothetical protein NTW31_01800 [Bacteroidetes bacterium]|nr:hypothetical protein [Bacteroidota bacterium]